MGDETTPQGDTIITRTLNAGPKVFTRDPARIVTDNLLNKSLIGSSKMKGPSTPRYVLLNSNDIYRSILDVYINQFKQRWKSLKSMVEPYPVGTVDPATYLARVYISHWFMELYVSVRDACLRHPGVEITDHYEKQISSQSAYYDYFLTALLQSIKPTHIVGCPEDTLYIPLISRTYRWNDQNKNYFGLTNFTVNRPLFRALISKMKDPSTGWHMAVPSNDPLGRPCWLLDWHNDKAYAWFPEEDNYNQDDTNLAFIIGVPCTPALAIADKDFPQQYPDNVEPDKLDLNSLERKIPRRFRGNINVRTILNEHRDFVRTVAQQVTRPVTSPAQSGSGAQDSAANRNEQALVLASSIPQSETVIVDMPIKYRVNLFRIIDYVYYACIIRKVEINMRSAAHKVLTFKSK